MWPRQAAIGGGNGGGGGGNGPQECEALLEEGTAAEVADKKPQGGRWLLWLPVVVSGTILYVLNFHSELYYRSPQHGHLLLGSPNTEDLPGLHKGASAFLVDSSACRIPALDPWDVQVRPYVKGVEPLECARGRGRQLVASNASALYVVWDALPDYNITDTAELSCCYKRFFRQYNENSPSDNEITYENNCTTFENEVAIGDAEFLRVLCYVDEEKIYEDFHAFAPRKPDVEERSRNVSKTDPLDDDALSVLVLGIDAVSRLNMHRQMPKTVQLLRQLGAIEMLGYNKVGDNTFPNLVAMQAGVSVEELKKICWPSDKKFFDKCRFLWDDFRDAGYRTAFGEDAPWMGIFNYVKRGFGKQPTDYYGRPFLRTIEDAIGHKKLMNAKMCVGSRMTAEVLLEYVTKFELAFKSERTFALFWEVSLTHDMLNYPSLGDDLHVEFIKRLLDEGALERMALFVVSDHGIRWGGIRETYQGRLEERLPLLFMTLPAWFRERYASAVANAGRNARRLTSPYDLHETLLDLMRPSTRLSQEAVRRRSREVALAASAPALSPVAGNDTGSSDDTRGISLFLQIPPNRTCEDAGITPHWCTCQTNLPVDKGSAIVNRTAEVLVEHINDMVRPFRQCSQLLLDVVKDAQLQVPQEVLHKDTKDSGVHDYVLVVRTIPGNAVFEGTVRYRPKQEEFSVAGYVSRLNLYGSQSACVNNYQLKLYCFCGS